MPAQDNHRLAGRRPHGDTADIHTLQGGTHPIQCRAGDTKGRHTLLGGRQLRIHPPAAQRGGAEAQRRQRHLLPPLVPRQPLLVHLAQHHIAFARQLRAVEGVRERDAEVLDDKRGGHQAGGSRVRVLHGTGMGRRGMDSGTRMAVQPVVVGKDLRGRTRRRTGRNQA